MVLHDHGLQLVYIIISVKMKRRSTFLHEYNKDKSTRSVHTSPFHFTNTFSEKLEIHRKFVIKEPGLERQSKNGI